jgi:SAM-dependent methyltransferase
LLAKHLGYERVVGVDLSAPMLDVARRNAERAGLADRVAFELGDVLDLDGIPDDSFDLATFTDAAHHLPNLDMVQSALTEMDRITAPSGMTLVMDLVRLKTEYLTARYLQAIGGEYLTRGLDQFFADFRDSMHAAWTPEELFSAVPKEPRRTWCHFAQSLLPTIQFAVGLPLGQLELFNRRGVPWSDADCPIPAKMRGDWRLLRATTLGLGRRKFFQPSASYSSLVCETLST